MQALKTGRAFRPRRLPRVLLVGALLAGTILVGLTAPTTAATLTLTRSISVTADDAVTTPRGFNPAGQIVALGAADESGVDIAGFRFSNITIPRGARILGVEFSLVKAGGETTPLTVDLAFEAADNAAPFAAADGPDARPPTTAFARVERADTWVAGRRYTLADDSALLGSLYEVINRAGWNAGNAVVLLVQAPNGANATGVTFRMSDAARRTAPQLVIRWAFTTTIIPPGGETPAPEPPPVAGQPCPAWVHDRYVARGPDGALYATWHPAVDPLFGCTFGHEHGDNPRGAPALRGRTVLFGYASTLAGFNEPHTGFKVFRWDDVRTDQGPSHNGASYLAVLHQGSSGAGRFTTVFHDIEVHYYQPADGREVHVHMLAPFGALKAGCGANDPRLELDLRQANAPGARVVATARCFNPPYIPYEDWLTALYVGSDAQGMWRAYLDPHFAIFDPNTFCIVTDGACTLGYSDTQANTGQDPAGNTAHFKGIKRETYLNQVWLRNAGGSAEFWTDPYGRLTSPDAADAILQFVSTVTVLPFVESTAFGAEKNPDLHGSVHAPN
ncbi:MAG: hypothetical protein DCC58_04090 [Chloroflexi bacterium]|nr:MAG: hypothetical protein DCC58_04090 [Chloroflexota bacterium]